MGVNLHREAFAEWLAAPFGPPEREIFLDSLKQHLGGTIPAEKWTISDEDYPRLGTYGAYDVFRHSLFYVHAGNFEDETYDASWLEPVAKEAFERKLKQAPDGIPYAATILDAGDTDTLFIPSLFDHPMEYGVGDEALFVTSLPGAMNALEAFAQAVGFDLSAEPEPEIIGDNWQPLATCRNIARIMYQFFSEEPDACVELG